MRMPGRIERSSLRAILRRRFLGCRVRLAASPAAFFSGRPAWRASAGFSKMMTCCQGRNSSDSLKMKPWGSTSRRTCLRVILCSGLMGTSGSSPRNSTRTSRPRGLKALKKPLKGGLGIGALVVDVDHQDQVDRRLGELGVGWVARMGLMLVTPASRAFRWSISQHLGLDVGGQDRSLGPDPPGQADAVVAGPGADVGHGRAAGDLEGIEHGLGLLFLDRASRGTASRPLAMT